MPRLSAKLRKHKKDLKELKKELDSSPEKFPRGRPPMVRTNEIEGRARKFRYIFNQVWDGLWPPLSEAETPQDVERAFQEQASAYYNRSEIWSAPLVLRILNDPKFPKLRDARVNFFADSLAGLGDITPRYSRDICAKERAKQKRAHRILRFEFYVECSCGFKGRSRDHGCRRCGTKINFPWHSVFPLEEEFFVGVKHNLRNVRT
jgi:hypothetical protein